jgi:glutathione-regulated potassium-efflux system ancillary protein KefG
LTASRPAFRARTTPEDDARVLILYCHPNPHRSRVNRALIAAVVDVPGVTVHDLYEAYPDHRIDVPFEQELLKGHHTTILHHPFYWYSTPPLLKEWMDEVLQWGWAYGFGGDKLRGKRMLNALTTGGSENAYQVGGFNRFTIRQLLAPIDQTAHLCGITYLPPFVVHGTHRLDDDAIREAARTYRVVVEALRDQRVPVEAVTHMQRLNADLDWTIAAAPAEAP